MVKQNSLSYVQEEKERKRKILDSQWHKEPSLGPSSYNSHHLIIAASWGQNF
jgi:hypothetical protein